MHVKELNKKFFDTFDYVDMEDFLSKHSCICDLFIEQEGYLSSEINGKSWLELLLEDPENAQLVLAQDKKKTQRVFSVKAKELLFDTETFIVSTFTDVTELENARVAALSAQKTKSAFLSTMSHELRTPLNAVIGFSQILMSKENMPQESIKSFVEKINSSGKHLLSIVNNILDFSKIDSGKMELSSKNFSLKDILDEAFLLFEGELEKKNITLERVACCDTTLFGDAQLIKQIVVNLLSNAIKFSNENSKVLLRYESDDVSHILEVCDDGIGLSQEQIDTLFDSFSQIKEHQNSAIKGTGLGLAISKKIAQLHGGDLNVTSNLGEGSCFRLSLPK
jgi:signal transduction histidine kinase